MRIAVCISGQLRGWKQAIENQQWFWKTSGAEVDYFLHTWDYSSDRLGVSQEYENILLGIKTRKLLDGI